MTTNDFLKGLIAGTSTSMTAFWPNKIKTQIDPRVFESSYRSREEDVKNLRNDFVKAMRHVQENRNATSKTKHY